MPISRRARDREGKIIEPMTLANMRDNGVRSISATCETCQHEAVLNADGWPADTPVPDVAIPPLPRLNGETVACPKRGRAAATTLIRRLR